MFLREIHQRRVNGEMVVHMQLAESVWNREIELAETRVVHSCGRAADGGTISRRREPAKSILSRVAPEDFIKGQQDWKLVNAWPYGDIYVLEQLWARLGEAGASAGGRPRRREQVRAVRPEGSSDRAGELRDGRQPRVRPLFEALLL